MSITCAQCLEFLDSPEEMVDSDARAQMNTHLEICPSCFAAADLVRQGIDVFREAPRPEPRPLVLPELIARITEDRVNREPASAKPIEARAGEALSRPPRLHLRWILQWVDRHVSPARWWVSAAAVIALLVWTRVPVEDVRTKGESSALDLLDVDLQAALERRSDNGEGTEILPVFDETYVWPGDGLIFRFVIEGGSYLMLLERDPDHNFQIVYERSGLVTDPGVPLRFGIAGPDGGVVRYVPGGPPGEYTYIAVLAPEKFEGDPARLDAIWGQYVERQLSPFGEPGDPTVAFDSIRILYAPDATRETEGGDFIHQRGHGEAP